MYQRHEIESKLSQIRSQFVEKLRDSKEHGSDLINTTSTTIDFNGLECRSPWEKCVKASISQLSMGIVNKGAYIDVEVCARPAMIAGLMTIVQDSTGFVELSVYNWLPRSHVQKEQDLDWAMPKGARIRIREPYLKQSGVNIMTMLSGSRPNTFIRVDAPDDIQFQSSPPDFARRYSHLVDPLLHPRITHTPPLGSERCLSNYTANVYPRESLTGQGLFTNKAVNKDCLVFAEKELVAAEGHVGMMFQASSNNIGDINTHALYEELVFLDRCSGGKLYSSVLCGLFPAYSLGESISNGQKIYEIVSANTFGIPERKDAENRISSAFRRANAGKEMSEINGKRSAIWIFASKMNHACAPNVYTTVIDDMMYVYARRDIAAGSELFTRYFDVEYSVPRTYGLPDERRYFVCDCTECKAWKARGSKSIAGIKAVLDAESEREIERACRVNSIDIENGTGLDTQAIYILRLPIFKLAQSWMTHKPKIAIVVLMRLLAALRKFDANMEMSIQVHLAIAENALFLDNMALAKNNLREAFLGFQRIFKGSRAQFIVDYAPHLSNYPNSILP